MQIEAEQARRQIVSICQTMLEGCLSYIEGARQIVALGFTAKLSADPDILAFHGIDSETDDLPFGEVRKLWSADSLTKLEPRIAQCQEWAENFGREHCQNLVSRFKQS